MIFSDPGVVEVSGGTCTFKFTRTGTSSTLSTTVCPVHCERSPERVSHVPPVAKFHTEGHTASG